MQCHFCNNQHENLRCERGSTINIEVKEAPTQQEIVREFVCRCSNCIQEYAASTHELFTRHPREVRETYCTHMIRTLKYAVSKGKDTVCATLHAFFPFLFAHVEDESTKKKQL